MSLVGFTKIPNNTVDSMRQAILDCLATINYSFEKEVKKVVIKPNLCYYWDYTTGQTTDPIFTAALIDVIRKKTSAKEISLVESDASAMKCKHIFKMMGYDKLAKEYNVKLVNLSEDTCEATKVTVNNHPFTVKVPKTIRDADLKINVPKIKYTMEEIKITCALKNIFGCNPYPKKFHYHPRLGEVIVAVNKAMKFDLCIIDANTVSGIQPRRLGLVMASKDPVAIDAAAARIAGVKPRSMKYLQLAQKEGLGTTSFTARGISPAYFYQRYPRKNVTKKVMAKAYRLITRLKLSKRIGLE
ncbi:MAG TPA: DUF362 domain-containing protein [Patescibacteria group bacterium]|nr:DUF362 domain-containing protein [Patescibacteria group bacterium]